MATHLTHYKVLWNGNSIQNELPTFRILLFRVRNVTKEDNRRVMSGSFTTSVKEEECPKCGSILKTLKKEGKHPSQPQQLYDKEGKRRSLASQSPIISSKFQTAYDEFISRLTFDIEALDISLQNLNTDDNTLVYNWR